MGGCHPAGAVAIALVADLALRSNLSKKDFGEVIKTTIYLGESTGLAAGSEASLGKP